MRSQPLPPRVVSYPDATRPNAAPLLWAAGGCAVLLFGALSAAADDGALAWLARTDEALSTRNYEGVFVHEHAGESETLRVVHRVGGDGVAERLVSMDGSGREFIRKGNQLTCYLPDQRTVLVERSGTAGMLLGSLPHLDATLAGLYQISELQRTRVSGRAARLIAVTPMDQMRYGYRVWVDEATAMPLKTQLRSGKGQVLEQIVFTDLRLPAHIPDSELDPAVDAHNFRWLQQLADPVGAPGLSISWEPNQLPPGFHMTVNARQVLRSGPVEHLVFTDGVASVSVFVDLGGGQAVGPATDDAATIGSSSAYSTVVQGYRVTAVGEVPPDTVRAIAQSIRTAGPAPVLPDTLLGLGVPRFAAPTAAAGTSIFDPAADAPAAAAAAHADAFDAGSGHVAFGAARAAPGGAASAAAGRH